ncbi:hypothetical protein B2G71_12485 [Novosphingobium sp. PC22D]|uniref:nuclear transport factor 2 family protein n=1 Tax=Novosphingobium sp. PC22D TaxID=1962403 RepID=UPI000BF03016|nr:nuclear transport factor 2 family protein [Novosphingobium sp. PC22D]PEQ12312.1 hypothetical protein B2G71_12485 [Novosphingobium sp. PC22D]
MDGLKRLEAIEAIRNLKARYFRLIDTKCWVELAGLFARDLEVRTPEGAVYVSGGQAYAESLRQSLERAVSCHQGLTGEVEITGDATARGIWAMQDVIEWAEAHPRMGWKSILGRGHYHETYRIENGAWRIATLTLTRLRLDVTWPDGRKPA